MDVMTPRHALNGQTSRLALRATIIAACALGLAACQSARFGGPSQPRGVIAAGPGPIVSLPEIARLESRQRPTFHEIRSLGSKLLEDSGADLGDIQVLIGHADGQ